MEEEYIYSSLLDIIQYGAKIAHDEGNINQVHIQKQERFFTSGVKIVRFFFIFSFIFFPCVNFKRYDLNFFLFMNSEHVQKYLLYNVFSL